MPFIYLPAGPMLRGNYAGRVLGSGSDAWKYWDERRAGNITDEEWLGVQGGIARSAGTCMTMGTASTMTAITDAMGLTLPGASSIPAVDAGHQRMAADCGRRIVEMVWEDLTPEKIVTDAAVRNAAIVAMATGCSTNAVVHLIAMARRAGVDLTLDDLDALGRVTPLIANVRPSGKDYLMEDFFYAGGLRALMKQIEERLDTSALTVTGKTLGENLEGRQGLQRRRHPPAVEPGLSRGLARGAARQPLRPPARSSSPPPATRNTGPTRGRRWSSTAIPR